MEHVSIDRALNIPSTWKRFCALMLDGLIIMALSVPILFLGGANFSGPEFYIPYLPYLINTILVVGLQFYFLKRWSRTPGKMALGLYVTNATTLKPGLSNKQIALRLIGGFSCFVLSLAPLALALLRKDRRQFSDLIAGTQVMQKVPRKKAAKERWIIGTILVVYFAGTGLWGAYRNFNSIRFTQSGFYMKSPSKEEPANKNDTDPIAKPATESTT